jgi:alpha-galactosidase/6-phospho-beta-glucosidase family protein
VKPIRIAVIGAGSRSFGPATSRDVLLSDPLEQHGAELVLMDINAEFVKQSEDYAGFVKGKLGRRNTCISSTTCLEQALDGADFVVTAIEVNRYHYWAQDFHIPRQFGFKQPYGENGGPGGIFHAMRNIPPSLKIAREMETRCPHAWMLNFTNPEHWLVEAVSRLTRTKAVGLCHGVFMGMEQIARLLQRKIADIEMVACGMNHFTFFQVIRDRKTGEDLYPALREADRKIDPMYDWHEIGLSRVFLRRFGLWPSPGANHIGEYLPWADEFVPSELQYHFDPAQGYPWKGARTPELMYHIGRLDPDRPMFKESHPHDLKAMPIRASGEVAVPFIEGMACGVRREIDAVNLPNRGAIPDLSDDTVVEVPAVADSGELRPGQMAPLPEAITAMLRLQGSIRKVGIEAYAEQSRDKLIQAMLLEPTVNSYRQAVAMLDTMLELQKEILPPFA